ncbi:hypothetical protein NHQ30_008326 [Ciborinia camelliae]|nr:hypothetical protein NHQ30_008326 [Ciborinia camelliae]
MSFGYSVGDFLTGANLTYRLIRALSESKGASIEYQEAIAELGTMQQTFLQISQMKVSDRVSQATVNAASHIVLSSMKIIGDFLMRTEKYREKLCGRGSGNSLSDSWQKMGWVLFKKEELKILRDSLQLKLSSISVLIATSHFHGEIPEQVAQYEVDDFQHSQPVSPPAYCPLQSPSNTSSATITDDECVNTGSSREACEEIGTENADGQASFEAIPENQNKNLDESFHLEKLLPSDLSAVGSSLKPRSSMIRDPQGMQMPNIHLCFLS